MAKYNFMWGIVLVVVLVTIWFFIKPEPVVAPIPVTSDTISYMSATEDDIVVSSPLPDDVVKNTITFTGKARGPWYFEASFPVEVRDSDGNLLGQGYGEAKSEWMTTEFVPFEGTVTYSSTSAVSGVLIIKNDNPSGEVEREKSVTIPIRFAK